MQENPQDALQLQKCDFRRKMRRRWMARFTLELFAYIECVMLVAVLGYRYCAGRIWYGTERYYQLIHMLHENWTAVICMVLLAGSIGIAYFNFYKIAHLTEQLTNAVGSVYWAPQNAIRLPAELKEEENQLNQIRLEAENSRQEAHEAQQRKNDMLMYMAHDLKTPLTSVIGYLTLLNEEAEIPQEARQRYLGIVLKKAQRLEELINGFFEITRFNFSHMILEKLSVNMTVMVNQMLYEFQPMFDEKSLRFSIEAEPDIFVYCDVGKMERVYDNLFKNAVNYSYPDTEIRVKLTRGETPSGEGENACAMRLVVENHGRTIPPEICGHLFEQFFRLDSARTSATGGSGLGLAVVKEIVQLHGGTVACESENEIIRFVVQLP